MNTCQNSNVSIGELSQQACDCPSRPGPATLDTQSRRHAFTLIEVMVALGIFFIAVFAILGVLTNCLRNARALQNKTADAGMVAATMMTSNIITEGLESDNFGDPYLGYTWTRDAYEEGTNGLYKVDILVQRPDGTEESRMSIFVYSPQSSQSATQRRSPFGAGRALR